VRQDAADRPAARSLETVTVDLVRRNFFGVYLPRYFPGSPLVFSTDFSVPSLSQFHLAEENGLPPPDFEHAEVVEIFLFLLLFPGFC